MGHIRDYSEATASAIDKEIRSIMNDAYTRTHEILEQHLDQLHDVASFLFKHEKMSGEEFRLVMEGKMQALPTEDTNALPPNGETPQKTEQQSEKSSEETLKADSESENAQENSSDQKPDSPQNPSAE
jgi:cell division protease FtsH